MVSMSEFSAEWLALREPADAAARSERLAFAVASRFNSETGLSVLDIGSGTGANARYLAERLNSQQRWLLVDHDPSLLIEASQRMRAWGTSRGLTSSRDEDGWRIEGENLAVTFATRLVDLADLSAQSELFIERRLVTASALFDLVSAQWVEALASECRVVGATMLFALNYDGRIQCWPEEGRDEEIRQLVNEHQQTDKGFGPALGPTAGTVAAECFGALGYHVERETSDWHLEPDAVELQRDLISGWARAALATAPGRAPFIVEWLERRLDYVNRGHSRIAVGHEDLALWLPEGR
jgi:SAM-dependent methyltransferase